MSEDKLENTGQSSQNVEMRRRIAELEGQVSLGDEENDFAVALITATPHPILVVNTDSTVRYVNPAFERFTGFASSEVLGVGTPRPWWDEDYFETTDTLLKGQLAGKIQYRSEVPMRTKQGVRRWIDFSATPVMKDSKHVFTLIDWADVTERRLAMETVRRQSQDILELSTPVMQVWRGVLIAPLVGSFDSERAEQFTEKLLHSITATSSETVLLDITGVPAVDTRTAQHLIDTMSAAKLLGAEVVLTGVRPAIAQTLVHLGIDLSGVVTRSSLAAGLQYALRNTELVVKRDGR